MSYLKNWCENPKSLFVVHVNMPLQENFSRRLNIDFDKENRELEKQNKRKLEEFLDEFNFTDITYTVEILKGKPDGEIVDFVRKRSIDLTFIGATGKTYLQRLMLGSVTENVLRELPSAMIVTKAENLLELKTNADILNLEMHYNKANKLEEVGYYQEAIDQVKICLQINDLHLPALNKLSRLYAKTGQEELSRSYEQKTFEVLRRLWNRQIELDIRKGLKF